MAQIHQWRGQGILSQEQAVQIIGSYESMSESADRKHTTALRSVMGIAAMLLGLGVLSLVGYNWDRLAATWKLLIIFAVILGTYAAAFYTRFWRKQELLSEILFLLGSLFYGIGIFLIAQIFHINAHYPDRVWWWALGVIPMAIAADSLILHALLCGLLAIWSGMELIEFDVFPSRNPFRWTSVFAGNSLLVLVMPTCIWGYSKRSMTAMWLVVLLIVWWLFLQPNIWNTEESIGFYAGAIGALMLLVAQCHRPQDRFSIPFRWIGVLLSAIALLVLSFHGLNKRMRLTDPELQLFFQTLLLLAVGVAIFLSATFAKGELDPRKERLSSQIVEVARRVWIPFGIFGLMFFFQFWRFILWNAWGPTIAFNLAMLGLALWLISSGLQEDRGFLFLSGVLYFLLWATVRYFDLFGDFGGLLGAALMFFLCSCFLFAVSIYWRRRKRGKDGRISS